MSDKNGLHKGLYGDGSQWITKDYFDHLLELKIKTKDRGAMKWTSLMLPEHVAMLKKQEAERSKVPRPDIDDQVKEEIEQIIRESIVEKSAVRFTYWIDGRFEEVTGYVTKLDTQRKALRIFEQLDGEGDRMSLAFDDIVAVEFI